MPTTFIEDLEQNKHGSDEPYWFKRDIKSILNKKKREIIQELQSISTIKKKSRTAHFVNIINKYL